MEHAMAMEQKRPFAEEEMHDCIKQEVAAEGTGQVEPNSGSHLEAIYIKTETPDAELEAVAVKEEPIDWKQEPQVDDDLQSIANKERIKISEDHPPAFLELVTSKKSLPPSQPSSSLLVSSPQLYLPSQSLQSISSHLLQSSTPLSQESVIQSGSLSSISMSCQNFSARASQPSTWSVEHDSAPKRKKQRNQLSSEAHQVISAAIEALRRVQAGNKNSNEFSRTGQLVVDSLQKMNPDQALEAQRIIFNILYRGQKGTLSKNSHIII